MFIYSNACFRWRQEKKTLSQLQSLAARLQLTTPTPNFTHSNDADSIRNSKRSMSRRSSGFDNPGFMTPQETSIDIIEYSNKFGSQNEFNASIFGLNASQYIGPPIISTEGETAGNWIAVYVLIEFSRTIWIMNSLYF